MTPRQIEGREQDLFQNGMREFNLLTQYRNAGFAGQWEEVADLILPNSRNTFFYGSYNTPGEKKTQLQVDSTGQVALSRFGAICDSLLTPTNMPWHTVVSDVDYVMKDKNARVWFEEVTRILFAERYRPHANFQSQNQANYQSLGAFGNGAMFIDAFSDRGRKDGLRYRGCPLGELFWGENHQGIIDRVCRWFKLTAWQAEEKWPGMLPANMQQALASKAPTLFDFLHIVKPRGDEYNPKAPDERRFPFTSYYLSITGQCLVWNKKAQEGMEQGYHVFPFAPLRFEQAPNESYGRGPAMMVLPALKTLNAEKAMFLKQAHRAADPVLLTADDGVVSFSLRPGALNKGGMSADGKPLVGVLPSGQIAVSEKMMEMEQSLINSAFFVDLFQILTETPQMSATEVIERTHEKGILIAPVLGRQESEYLGPGIERELDVLAAQGKLPPMPPRVREARASYKVVYQSPLARSRLNQEVSGTLRVVENVREIVAITGDPSPLDRFNFDNFTQDAALIGGTRERWLNSDQDIAKIRKNRAAAQQQDQNLKSLPGKAAIMNAQAKIAKSNGAFPQQGQGALSPPQGGQQ